jgi:hypothetical protein
MTRTLPPLLALLLLTACPQPEPDDDDSALDDDDATVDDDDDAVDDDDDATPPGRWDPDDFDHVYEVGPGHELADPNEVPWEALQPSTLVRIHHRPEPYAAKWVINVAATEQDPVVVLGVPDGNSLPIITGDGATTRPELDYWNEDRSVIKVGGASAPDAEMATWVYIELLAVRSAHPDYGFTDDAGGAATYTDNAASIHVERGQHVTIRECDLHDSGNGLFVGGDASDLRVIGNQLWDNGIVGSDQQHNSYTEARGILFEANAYGSLRTGALGNSLKDRSSGLVVRYNLIQSGNRQLDLVDSGSDAILTEDAYQTAFVYGNLLVEEADAGNSQVVHYGGDSGDPDRYRKGTLHFFSNTVVSHRYDNTTLLRLSSPDEHADVRNNVVHVVAGAGALALFEGDGTVDYTGNHLTDDWVDCHCTPAGTLNDLGGNLTGLDPGIENLWYWPAGPLDGSPLIDAAVAPAAGTAEHPVDRQPTGTDGPGLRPDDGAPDIGAYERG